MRHNPVPCAWACGAFTLEDDAVCNGAACRRREADWRKSADRSVSTGGAGIREDRTASGRRTPPAFSPVGQVASCRAAASSCPAGDPR